MRLEEAIIERVEVFARHSVFPGSDEVMEDVLEDLGYKADANQISRETYWMLREVILRSPHLIHRN